MSTQAGPILYREAQQFRQWWVVLLISGTAALAWWGFYEQIGRGRPWGSNPGPDWVVWVMWLIFGLLFPLWFYRARLIFEVTPQVLRVRLWPLTRRDIPLAEITAVQPRTYSPLREFGGWGVRGLPRNMAYNVSGDQGVQLTLRDGKRVLLGTQRPQELALALGVTQHT